ncbi:type II secretion system F family protein [Ramlibacter humi]|uniref:Type II secretion system F family protein n=1 Tax=Ramlibacter humi TaxID=2530451 RepID=A0A4Z0BES1_9BURK|nr:type II secretion system F family protein [Ramlibacter humi]TFY96368.1 type II secretion system F family protein [Ramlibacter humi]
MDLKRFRVVAIDVRGLVCRHEVQGESVESACAALTEQGFTIVEAAHQDGLMPKARFSWTGPAFHAGVFAEDLAMLLGAGMTITDALNVLSMREQSSAGQRLLAQVIESLRGGQALSQALGEHEEVFPALLVSTIAASEQTGDLVSALERYAAHQRSFRALRDRAVGACVYPLLLLALGTVIFLFLVFAVIPRFSRLLDGTTGDLPFLSAMLLSWGRLLDENPTVYGLAIAALFAAAGACWTALRSRETRARLIAGIPIISRLVREFRHLQMYRSLCLLTGGGIPLVHALASSRVLLDPHDQIRLAHGMRAISNGASISSALAECGLADPVATGMLAAADKTGTLPQMLDRIAGFYEAALTRNIEVASRLIEPLLMIAIGTVIGGLVLLMYLPIFDLASRIG